MQDSGLTEIKPLMRILAISGQHPVLSCPKSPQGSLCGLLLWLVGCDILCLLKWQAAFFIHNLQFKLHWHSAFLFVKSGNHNGEHSPSPIPLWFVGWFLLIKLIYLTVWGFQVALMLKNLPGNAGDIRGVGSIPESGRSPGDRNGNPIQYSCLENPMNRGTWRATVSL